MGTQTGLYYLSDLQPFPLEALADLPVPARPKSVINLAEQGGGKAIASEATLATVIDLLRSSDTRKL